MKIFTVPSWFSRVFGKQAQPHPPNFAGTRFYIRDAAEADVENIVTMKNTVWEDAYRDVREPEFFERMHASTPEQVEFWRRQLRKGQTLWMAEDLNGTVVGVGHAAEPREKTVAALTRHGVEVGNQETTAETEAGTTALPRASEQPESGDWEGVEREPEGRASEDQATEDPESADQETRTGPESYRELDALYVLPSARGAGIGRELVHKALGESAGVLWVITQNHLAIEFFQHLGFESLGEPQPVTEGPSAGTTEQLMIQRD